MPRRTRYQTPAEPDYSPTEVANLGLLGIGRAAIYRQIRRNEIKVIYDEYGYERITQSEIERLQHLRGIKPKKAPEMSAEVADLKHKIQVESGREGGKMRSVLHSKEEIAGWFAHGRREKLIARIDPHHTLSKAELERKLNDEAEAQLSRARRAKLERQLWRQLQQQPGNHA